MCRSAKRFYRIGGNLSEFQKQDHTSYIFLLVLYAFLQCRLAVVIFAVSVPDLFLIRLSISI